VRTKGAIRHYIPDTKSHGVVPPKQAREPSLLALVGLGLLGVWMTG
jgi:hypothetical protein